ncbi:hypothetical protein MMC34_003387 [Xylographa carneopallida]|nr:hypothetical protein [Xylographa carneopallida]
MANMTNIENVWGKGSSQYREADAMAAEYLRNFMGSRAGATVHTRQIRSSEGVTTAVPQEGAIVAMNLAFRPKVLR